MDNSRWLKLLLCVTLCIGIGWLGGIITEQSVKTWYPTLIKPSWNPPNWVFPIVWTILYTMMGISLWLIIETHSYYKTPAYIAFGIQLFLNFIWSWLFFYLHSPLQAFLDIILLWVAIVVTIRLFWQHSHLAAYLLVPYLFWVTYAISLNLFILIHNPP